jgi:regulatory protein YycI of two-component signal transduction system YycFG
MDAGGGKGMDWRRAKSVLILAFLLLNALLGYQLWMEWRTQVNTTVDWTSLPADTRQVIQEKKIRVDATIPAETPAMKDLSFKLKTRVVAGPDGRTAIGSEPETRIVFNTRELNDALGTVVPELNKYVYDDAGSREGVFVLNRTTDGFPIFDIRLELYYSDQKIRSYREDVIENLSTDNSQGQKVLPASKAVALLITNYLPANSVIKEIRLGYHGQIFPDAETQVSAPTWRVLLENGEVYYVHAISAEVTSEKGGAPLSPITN